MKSKAKIYVGFVLFLAAAAIVLQSCKSHERCPAYTSVDVKCVQESI